jgi:hypothetical protein
MKKIRLTEKERKMLEKALDEYTKFHWGVDPDKIFVADDVKVPKVVYMLGYLKAVIYTTKKQGDEGETDYIHYFKKPLPILCADVNGNQLYIVGGGYKVKEEGIVN